MEHAARLVTAEDLIRMSHDGLRRELVRGEVKQMPPAGGEHGFISSNVNSDLRNFVRRNRLGYVFAAETGFIIERDPDTVRAPDCAFVSRTRLPGPVPRKYVPMPPDLAVETLSPDDRRDEVAAKIAQWLQAGVRLVWVLDPEARTVTVHRPGMTPRLLGEGEFLDGEDVVPGFRSPVADLWA